MVRKSSSHTSVTSSETLYVFMCVFAPLTPFCFSKLCILIYTCDCVCVIVFSSSVAFFEAVPSSHPIVLLLSQDPQNMVQFLYSSLCSPSVTIMVVAVIAIILATNAAVINHAVDIVVAIHEIWCVYGFASYVVGIHAIHIHFLFFLFNYLYFALSFIFSKLFLSVHP